MHKILIRLHIFVFISRTKDDKLFMKIYNFLTQETIALYLGIAAILLNIYTVDKASEQQIQLEKQKFEYSLYINALNSSTKEQAIEQLKFYKDLNLINNFNPKIKERIEKKEIPIINPNNSFRKNEIAQNIFEIGGVIKQNQNDIIGVYPPLFMDDGECIGKSKFEFVFMDKTISPLILDGVGHIVYLDSCEDINNDGLNELIIVRSGVHGCWYSAKIYAYVNEKWNMLHVGSVYGCNDDNDFSNRISRKNGESFFLEDTFMDSGITKIETKIRF